MDRFQYLLLMGVCFGVDPAAGVRVPGRRSTDAPGGRLRALRLPVLTFAVWDTFAIARHHWSFNSRDVTGWELPFRLPMEEVAFFVVIPGVCPAHLRGVAPHTNGNQ